MPHCHMTHHITHTNLYIHLKALHARTHRHKSQWIKPVCLWLQSSFVVRQNRWTDVVAVVITLGLMGSRKLSSYKPRVKAEGKHRHQNNKKLSQRSVVTQRSKERERVCWGKSRSSQSKVIKPNQKEREQVKTAEEGNKAAQNCQWNNR